MWGRFSATQNKENGDNMAHPTSNTLEGEYKPSSVVSADEDEGLLETDDQMIDILQHHPEQPSIFDDDDDDVDAVDDYVPESLASFVKEVSSNLQDARRNFMDDVNGVIMNSFESNESVTSPSRQTPREDDADRQLKSDVLDSIDQRHAVLPTPRDASTFWSPELKQTPPPNPVADMTESEIKREVRESLISPPPPAVPEEPLDTLADQEIPAVASELPEETKLMELVSSIEMENEEEVESNLPSGVITEGNLDNAASPEETVPSSADDLEQHPKACDAPPLESEPEMEIDFASAESEMEVDFSRPEEPLDVSEILEKAQEHLQPPTPDRSQVTHVGDVDEAQLPETATTPSPLSMSSPSGGVNEVDSTTLSTSTSERKAKPTPLATSQGEEKAPALPSIQPRSPDRARSIRRTVEMAQRKITSSSVDNEAGGSGGKKSKTIAPRATKASLARAALRSPEAQKRLAAKKPRPTPVPRPTKASMARAATRSPPAQRSTKAARVVSTRSATSNRTPLLVPRATRASKALESVNSPNTLPTSKPRKESAEDARARARERIREKMKKEKMVDMLKKVSPRKPIIKRATTDEKIARARERAEQRQREKEAARRRTIRPDPEKVVNKKVRQRPVRRILGTKTADGTVKPSVPSGRTKVTVPHAPKFATTARCGEPKMLRSPPVSMASSTEVLKRGLREDLSLSTPRVKLTMPHAPHFATTKRHGEKVMTPGGGFGTATLAQSDDILRSGLRKSTPLLAPSNREPGLTVPVAPKFHKMAKRELPKSTKEREQEIVDYYKSHPFKAGSIMQAEPHVVRKTAQLKRRLTSPRPFSLRTDVRGASSETPLATDRDAEDLKEINTFKFHARPMPKFARPKQQVQPARSATRSQTETKPFRLSSRKSKASTAEDQASKGFQARPVPKTTYHASPVHGTKVGSQPSDQRTVEGSRRRTDSKAFALRSSERHDKYQKQMKEKLEDEEAERQRQMEFHARPFRSSPPPKISPSNKSPTHPEPFAMPGMRHFEAHQEDMEKKRSEIEEKEEHLHGSFRARPVPLTTYTSPARNEE